MFRQSFVIQLFMMLTGSCPDKTWKHINSECFKVMDNTEFYDKAFSSCQEAGGELLPFGSRYVLLDLNITSVTWLGNLQENDNTTSDIINYYDWKDQRNITSTRQCPNIESSSPVPSFDCNKSSTVVCQAVFSTGKDGKGMHLKMLVAIIISGVILLIFLTLVIYSAKSRLDSEDRQNSETVVYGKYTHLQQVEDVKLSVIKEQLDSVPNKTILSKTPEQSAITNGEQRGVSGEESVRIKNGKYVQFSVPSADSEQMLNDKNC